MQDVRETRGVAILLSSHTAHFQLLMSPRDRAFGRFLQSIEAFSDEEKVSKLVSYFSALTETMSRESLVALRASIIEVFPKSAERTAILEVLDGQLALFTTESQGQSESGY
jgi:hypothetical protein